MCNTMFMWDASSVFIYASLTWTGGCFGHVAVCKLFWTLMARIWLLPLPLGMGRPIPRLQWGSKPCSRCALWLCTMLQVATETRPDTASPVPVPAFCKKRSFQNRRSYMQLSPYEWLGKLNMWQLTFALLFKYILSLFIITSFLRE